MSLDPHARIPYSIQYGFGIERQLTASSSFAVNYIGTRGIDLFRSIDVNAPLPPAYAARPNAGLGQNRQLQPEGYQKSNALELSFRGRPKRFFTGQAQYTPGKTYNNTSGITYFPANSYSPNADWGGPTTIVATRSICWERFQAANGLTLEPPLLFIIRGIRSTSPPATMRTRTHPAPQHGQVMDATVRCRTAALGHRD